jgi:protease I
MRAKWSTALLLVICLAAVLGGCGKQESTTSVGPSTTPGPAPEPPQLAEALTGGSEEAVTPAGDKKVLMVVAPHEFRDEEYKEPRAALEAAGYEVVVASLRTGKCEGALGATVEATIAADDVVPTDYAGVVFVGGPGMVAHLNDPRLIACAQGFDEAELVVSAICVAPAILANAGLLDGVEATVFESEEGTLTSGGATPAAGPVVVSGRIITANGPSAAGEFGKRVVETLDAQ